MNQYNISGKSILQWIGIAALLVSPVTAMGTDYTGTNFIVKDPVIEGLGGYSTSASFQLWGTIPFIESRTGTSSSFINLPGFLNFSATTTAATTVPPAVIGGGVAVEPRPKKPKPPADVLRTLDFNKDGRINLIDLSILLFYADKLPPEIDLYDLNSDGVVDLVDVSILLYYWYDP